MYSLFNFRDAAEESEDSTDSSASFVQVQSLGLDNFEKGKEENEPEKKEEESTSNFETEKEEKETENSDFSEPLKKKVKSSLPHINKKYTFNVK
jgi:hypothetical protein